MAKASPAKLAYIAAWRKRNSDKIRAGCCAYYLKNKTKSLLQAKSWAAKNPEKRKKIRAKNARTDKAKARRRIQRRADVNQLISGNLRGRVIKALKCSGARKCANTASLLSCSIPELREHLQKQFQPGMSWDNRGQWHIDHKRPCASFNLTDPEQQKQCFHFMNLQPLWAADNIRKGAHY